MSDNPLSTEVEEQDIIDSIISDLACSFEEILPQATINDDSNYDDVQNSTCSKSMVVKTQICSDNQNSECDTISSKNKNVRCNEENLDRYDTVLLSDGNSLGNNDDHNDAAVSSDDNDNNWEDIDDNDGDNNDDVLLNDNILENIDCSNDPTFLIDDSYWDDIDDNYDIALLTGDNNDTVPLSYDSSSKNIDDHNDTVSLSYDSSSKNIDDHNDTVSLSFDSSSKNIDDHNDTVSLSYDSSSKNIDDHNDTVSLSYDSSSKNIDDHNDNVSLSFDSSSKNIDHNDTVSLSYDSSSKNIDHNDTVPLSYDSSSKNIDDHNDTVSLSYDSSSKNIDDHNDNVSLSYDSSSKNIDDHNDTVSLSYDSSSKNIDDHNDNVSLSFDSSSKNIDHNDTVSLSYDSSSKNIDHNDTVPLSYDSSSKNIDDHNDTVSLSYDSSSKNIDDHNDNVSLSFDSSSKNIDDHKDNVSLSFDSSSKNIDDHNDTVSLSYDSSSKNIDDHKDNVSLSFDSSSKNIDDHNDTVSLSYDSSSKNIDDHNDIAVLSDGSDSNWEDIDDNNDTVSLSHYSSLENIEDHNGTDVLSDDNDSDWEDIDDNHDTALLDNGSNSENNDIALVLSDDNDIDGDNNDTVSLNDDSILENNDELSNNTQNDLPIDPILLTLNFAQAKVYSYMNSNPIIKNFIHESSTFDDDVVMYDIDEIVEIIDARRFSKRSFYLVKWKNWSRGFNTWERFDALYKSQTHIFAYFERNRHSGKPIDEPINIIHLMLSRQIITHLFELFRTQTGLSLPSITLDFLSDLLNTLGQGPENAQIMRKKCVRSYLSSLSLDFFRQLQSQSLRQWEIDINVVSLGHNVYVINNIDLEEPPNSFVYIPDCISEAEIIVPDNPPSGCLCKKDCLSSTDCCNKFSGQAHAYDEYKKLIVIPDGPIFECNKECKCMSNCVNRVVQHGSKVNVCISKSRFPGWTLKTYQDIEKGRFVGIYVGEIITVEEYKQRLQNSSSFIDYAWELDFSNTSNFKCVVDSTHYGNFTRFINHSCEANLSVHTVWIDCLDKYFPQLALFANRKIFAGEHLTTDYFVRKSKDSLKKSGTKCQCEMKSCKGYYF